MPTREELMNLLCNFLQVAPPSITAADPGEVRLIQDPAAPTTFPHVVEIAGAPVHPGENNVWHGSRHHQEDAQWQQCATKMTRFGLRLVDRQGSMVKGQSPVRLAGVPQLATTAAWARTAANGAAICVGERVVCFTRARVCVRLSRHGVDIYGSTLQQVRAPRGL